MSKDLLIIFVKNPELGKVKTRLAKSIGDSSAYNVYKKLVETTESITSPLELERHIYFSNKITKDCWYKDFKAVQEGIDLGERMLNAFINGFNDGYDRIVLIGSDLPDITEEIINTAFTKLQESEVVVGPSEDGGYYLIGMTHLYDCIFINKSWSTPKLFNETLSELQQKNVRTSLMKTLNDIDTFEDLKQFPEYLKLI